MPNSGVWNEGARTIIWTISNLDPGDTATRSYEVTVTDFTARPYRNLAEITQADQVQVYESMMVDPAGRVTTGLLSGARYVKDNRLLPRGMNKATATADVAVHGAAATDTDFGDGRDRVTYRVALENAQGPLTVTAELWYQPIGYRWAVNFRNYDAPEPKRFIGYWDSMAAESALALARGSATVR